MSADPDANNLILLFCSIVCFIITVLYSYSSSVIDNINRLKITEDSEAGNPLAKKIEKILDLSFISPLRIGYILFYSLFLIFTINLVHHIFKLTNILYLKYIFDIIIFFLSIILIFIIPAKLSLKESDVIRYKFLKTVIFLYKILFPLAFVTDKISFILLSVFGFKPESFADIVTEDEIIHLLGEGEEDGSIEETEKDMIENILEFDDKNVSEIMTHRIDIKAIEASESFENAIQIAVDFGYSRIPVYSEDIDKILGIIYIKDLLPYVGKSIPNYLKLKDFLREAYYIPESKKCSQLFKEMTEKKTQIAIIIDEYGGTSGLISLEDLLESIVGNIQDEYDNEDQDIQIHNENEITIDGSTTIDEVEDLLETKFPEGDYDTIAGYITDVLGRILSEDEHPCIEYDNLKITVLNVEDQRIVSVHIIKNPKKENID